METNESEAGAACVGLSQLVSQANLWLNNSIKSLEQHISEDLRLRASYKAAVSHLAAVQLALQLSPHVNELMSAAPPSEQPYPDTWFWTRIIDQHLVKQVVDNHTTVGFNIEDLEPFRHWKPETDIILSRLRVLAEYYQVKSTVLTTMSPSNIGIGLGFPIDYLRLLVALKIKTANPQG